MRGSTLMPPCSRLSSALELGKPQGVSGVKERVDPCEIQQYADVDLDSIRDGHGRRQRRKGSSPSLSSWSESKACRAAGVFCSPNACWRSAEFSPLREL